MDDLRQDIDMAAGTLIGFKLFTCKSQIGRSALLQLKVASSEYGVRTITIECGADWAKALSNGLTKAAEATLDTSELGPLGLKPVR